MKKVNFMKLERVNQIFSNMEWLDAEIKRNEAFEGRNEFSDLFYKTLESIRRKQQDGIVPYDEYKLIGKAKSLDTIDYGYYIANIHYELFNYDIADKDTLEDRIIFFLNNANKELFKDKNSWFRLNFINDFRKYLKEVYSIVESYNDLEYIIDEFCGPKEKEIYKILWTLFLKKEYFEKNIFDDLKPKEMTELFVNAQIIDIDDFLDEKKFIDYCKTEITERVNIIRKYSILWFKDCESHELIDVRKLRSIVIYCGKYNYELQELLCLILDDIGSNSRYNIEYKFGIMLLTDF